MPRKLALTILFPVFAVALYADGTNASVLPPSAKPNPEPYKELSAKWWQWAYAIPWSSNPMNDPSGANCAVNQSGPVWFLAGTAGGYATRTCTIPSDVSIFFPIVNVMLDYPCPDPSFEPAKGQSLKDFLTATAKFYIDPATNLQVEVDGIAIQNPFAYRATSSLVQFTGHPSLTGTFDSCVTGSPQQGVSDGYWMWLKPLSPGPHTIHFHAENPAFPATYDVTYYLLVAGSSH